MRHLGSILLAGLVCDGAAAAAARPCPASRVPPAAMVAPAAEETTTAARSKPLIDRRRALQHAVTACTLSVGAPTALLCVMQLRRVGASTGDPSDVSPEPLLATLRSSTGSAARSERAALSSEWQQLRVAQAEGRIDRDHTTKAFESVLQVRLALGRAEELAQAQRLAKIDDVISRELVVQLERAATLLASSPELSPDARATIGWQWGACGWRRCGAQADGAQAMCKLRANLGMIVPLEALFYLDVAKRAVDEILQLGVSEGLLDGARLPRSTYLDAETLDMFLATDDESGDTGATDELREWEEATLRAAGLLDDGERVVSSESPEDVVRFGGAWGR